MNLKESFRYQKFLDYLMDSACESITDYDHCLKVTKKHCMHKANPDAEDVVEEIEPERPFVSNDDVIRFMKWLVDEKRELSDAICYAKMTCVVKDSFDIDSAIEANKFRQQANRAIKSMLRRNGFKKTERGQSWKFNNDGVQSAYYYDIEVTSEEAFDREASKDVMRDLIMHSDLVSAKIDQALINTKVDFKPKYDVNESFEDVIAEFVSV